MCRFRVPVSLLFTLILMFAVGSSSALAQPPTSGSEMMQQSRQRMQDMQADANKRMDEMRQRQDEQFEQMKNGNFPTSSVEEESSSSGRGFRIRGRTIKGLVILVGVLGAGLMKVLGFFGGSKESA